MTVQQGETQERTGPVWRLVGQIGSSLALFGAVLFYFGWVRAKVEAEALGYDVSVLDLTPTDFVLRSIGVLSPLLLVLLLAALLLNRLHERRIVPLVTDPTRAARARLYGSIFKWTVIVLTAACVGLLTTRWRGIALPLAITLPTVAAIYGNHLRGISGQAVAWLAPASVLTIALLVVAIFWDTERVARYVGTAYADDIAARPTQFPAVTIYSDKSLRMEAPGVAEQPLAGKAAAYRFRYTGLRLIQRTGDRYLLINQQWRPQQGRVLILRESSGLRLEFSCSHSDDGLCSGPPL